MLVKSLTERLHEPLQLSGIGSTVKLDLEGTENHPPVDKFEYSYLIDSRVTVY